MRASDHPCLKHRLRAESGQAIVEFVLVVPLILVILFGIVEFSRAYNYWNDVNQLAADGARFAAVGRDPSNPTANPPDTTALESFIKSQADTAELRTGGTGSIPNALKVCVTAPDGNGVGKRVLVTVKSSYNFLGPVGITATGVTMTGTATMRLEAGSTTYPTTNATCA